MAAPVMDEAEVAAFLEEIWPGSTEFFTIEEIGEGTARIRMPFAPHRLRPGGIIAGPQLMSLADAAVWIALLGRIGRVTMTVTQSLQITFLRPAAAADVIAETRLHKVGKRLATGDVLLYNDGDAEPVAHATVTYAIPLSHPAPTLEA